MTLARPFLVPAALALLAAFLPAQLAWRGAGIQLLGRCGHFAFFDEARGRVTVYGGQIGYTVFGNHCFQLADNEWTLIPVPPGTARGYGATCEDPIGGIGLLFGGADQSGNLFRDTLRFNRELLRFDLLSPVTSPPSRRLTAMAFHAGAGNVVLFGGRDQAGPLGDTWVWQGDNWSQRLPGLSPAARANHAMAYDAARGRVVLYGGHNGAVSLSDTWTYDGGKDWTKVTSATGPGAIHNMMLAYDANRSLLVLFGGNNDSNTVNNETWEWDGKTWQQRSPATRPPARQLASLTYDKQRRTVVLFGGLNQAGTLLADAWAWDGQTWTEILGGNRGTRVEPSARTSPFMAYSQQLNKRILFGGFDLVGRRYQPLNDTWESVGALWRLRASPSSPPASFSGAGAILRGTGDVYWFPGRDTQGNSYNQQWNWGGQQWAPLTLSQPAIASLRSQVVGSLRSSLYGWVLVRMLTSGTAPPYASTLQLIQPFSGQVANVNVPGGPGAREGAVMVQGNWPAVASDRVFLFGGAITTSSGTTYHNDVWELADTGSGGNLRWTQLIPATGPVPPPRMNPAAAFDGRLLCVMGGASPATLGDSWTFDVTTRQWRQITGTSPAARAGAAMTFDMTVGLLSMFGGDSEGLALFGDHWYTNGQTFWQSLVTESVPSTRVQHSMVYDRANHRCIVFGGDRYSIGWGSQTWSYDGSTWSPIVGSGAVPSPRISQAACFDEANGAMVMFGWDTRVLWGNDLWTRGAPGPESRDEGAMVYMASQRRCLLFGGGGGMVTAPLGDAWIYDLGTDRWQVAASGPPARRRHAMAYDRRRDRVVLFGGDTGYPSNVALDDTWEYQVATGWQKRTPVHRPPPRYWHAMAFDESRGRTVLFGGVGLNDFWEWDGTDWQQRAPETLPPPIQEGAAMAYDSDHRRVVLFGGKALSTPPPATMWYLDAPIDVTGRGNTANPEAFRYYSQPALGRTCKLGFNNPQGVALLGIGAGPLQQPILQMGSPMCEMSNLYALTFFIVVAGRTEPNVAMSIANNVSLRGTVLVLQGLPFQAAACLRATDALNVRVY